MEALEADRREMEKRFTIQQQDVEKLKEKEVLRKSLLSVIKNLSLGLAFLKTIKSNLCLQVFKSRYDMNIVYVFAYSDDPSLYLLHKQN